MTSDGTTPVRHLRVPDDLWEDLGVIAKVQGTSRAAIMIELSRWYVDEYGLPAMPRLPIPPRPARPSAE